MDHSVVRLCVLVSPIEGPGFVWPGKQCDFASATADGSDKLSAEQKAEFHQMLDVMLDKLEV